MRISDWSSDVCSSDLSPYGQGSSQGHFSQARDLVARRTFFARAPAPLFRGMGSQAVLTDNRLFNPGHSRCVMSECRSRSNRLKYMAMARFAIICPKARRPEEPTSELQSLIRN